ncbi:unnamed protein product [Linum tenue]|uniref:Uncharacterized protein n=1 Tax=Linum tenue TaxID=586396 RepID=A0AAV0Q775_9ROSI|nr:unnamed protein product [Linum tenue]
MCDLLGGIRGRGGDQGCGELPAPVPRPVHRAVVRYFEEFVVPDLSPVVPASDDASVVGGGFLTHRRR